MLDQTISFEGRVILETNAFIVVPSLGQIVEGYCLVVAKSNVINLSEMENQEIEELKRVINLISVAIAKAYSAPLIFEHGAIARKNEIGCGVDRAHLHLVPNYNFHDVVKIMDKQYSRVYECNTQQNWLDYKKKALRPYMVISDNCGSTVEYSYGEYRESQCIRRILAMLSDKNVEWDWKKYNNEPSIQLTLGKISMALGALRNSNVYRSQ